MVVIQVYKEANLDPKVNGRTQAQTTEGSLYHDRQSTLHIAKIQLRTKHKKFNPLSQSSRWREYGYTKDSYQRIKDN